jgi:hypothetical protein
MVFLDIAGHPNILTTVRDEEGRVPSPQSACWKKQPKRSGNILFDSDLPHHPESLPENPVLTQYKGVS